MAEIGVLFDLDGVLIDSETTYTKFWSEIGRIYPTGLDNFAIAIKGTTLPSILEYFPDASVRENITKRLLAFQAVSYTHLDVYKRQIPCKCTWLLSLLAAKYW